MNITKLIHKLIRYYLTEYQLTAREINSGNCVDFAADILSELGGESEKMFELNSDMFYCDFKEDVQEFWGEVIEPRDGGVWSKPMLDLYGYPPVDVRNFYIGHHVWVFYNGKHYDSESPLGTNKWYELNFFKRTLKKYKSL
jgi:hypothetical protein